VPQIPGLVETGYWTSDDVLDAAHLPSSFIVLGGGAIALEMAHYLEALGRKVTLIQRGKGLLTGMDQECGEVVSASLAERGITVFCGTALKSFSRSAVGKTVCFDSAAGSHSVSAQEILVAMGREAALADLGLEQAGVQVTAGKVATNSFMQTTNPRVFAAGDVTASLDVVHLAIQDAEVAARNAARLLKAQDGVLEVSDHRLRLFGVFCEPQAAAVGANEAELKAAEVPFITASYPFNDHGKSMTMGVKHGFVKMLAHAQSGEILGACVVGPEATELIHEVVVAMAFRATVKQFLAIPHYHPTLSEIWTYPAEELADLLPVPPGG
jgi:pyruvate/2-oxoglutarate dehydrogenase complex dihydrolipoamide dehydrogenase (E3) component